MNKMKSISYASNSNRKAKWAVKLYTEWRDGCIATKGAEYCDTNILKTDLLKPQLLEEEAFCDTLCKFVTEMRKHNEYDYPPQTVRGIITAI